MNGKQLLILLAVILVLRAIYYGTKSLYRSPLENSPTFSEKMMNEKIMGGKENMMSGKIHQVEMMPNGFNPSSLMIAKGDTVEFVNKDEMPRWPASGIHPTHEICRGFDSLRGIAPGETYSFTFTEAKDCPMHDHLNAALRGRISVR